MKYTKQSLIKSPLSMREIAQMDWFSQFYPIPNA